MLNNLPNCPKCNSEYVYEDGALLVCPEWPQNGTQPGRRRYHGDWRQRTGVVMAMTLIKVKSKVCTKFEVSA